MVYSMCLSTMHWRMWRKGAFCFLCRVDLLQYHWFGWGSLMWYIKKVWTHAKLILCYIFIGGGVLHTFLCDQGVTVNLITPQSWATRADALTKSDSFEKHHFSQQIAWEYKAWAYFCTFVRISRKYECSFAPILFSIALIVILLLLY